MIFTVVGKPGGGKSFYSLRHIVNVLAHTENVVVTNLSVKISDLHAYLAAKYPEKAIDTPKRVRILTVEQSRRFWLHRLNSDGLHVDLDDVTRDDEKKGKHVDYERVTGPNRDAIGKGLPRVYPGVDYVIDECHVFFDARAWADSGMSLTYYNSQHRKLDDNVTFVTQFLELIDKRVKSFSQEFIYLRNNGAEKFLTLFRGPSYFTAKHYQRPPTGLQDMASEVHRFSLDVPLANCYDTSAGVGISGVGRPEAKRKKGFNILWLIVPFVGFLVALALAPDLLASAVLGTKSGKYSAETLGAIESKGSPAAPGASLKGSAFGGDDQPRAERYGVRHVELPYPTGYIVLGAMINVQMSDGTVRTERDKELQGIQRNSVTLAGEKLFIRPAHRQPGVATSSAFAPDAGLQVQPVASAAGPVASSWRLDPDGVYRLVSPSSVGKP